MSGRTVLLVYAVAGGLLSSGTLGFVVVAEGVRDVPAAAWITTFAGVFLLGALFMIGIGYLVNMFVDTFSARRASKRGRGGAG